MLKSYLLQVSLAACAAAQNKFSENKSNGLPGFAKELEGQIDMLQMMIDQLQTNLATANGQIATLQTTVSALDTRVGDNEDDIESQMGLIAGLDTRVGENEENLMDLFSRQVTADFFEVNPNAFNIPIQPDSVVWQTWTVKAGETVDMAGQISLQAYRNAPFPRVLRAFLYSQVAGEEEQELTSTFDRGNFSDPNNKHLSILYRHKVLVDTTFTVRLDGANIVQQVPPQRAQFGYKIYGSKYGTMLPSEEPAPASNSVLQEDGDDLRLLFFVEPEQIDLILYKGENCDGDYWNVGSVDTIASEMVIRVDDLEARGWNDSISSVVIPSRMTVDFWADGDFGGRKETFNGLDEKVCQQMSVKLMDNIASSIKIYNSEAATDFLHQ